MKLFVRFGAKIASEISKKPKQNGHTDNPRVCVCVYVCVGHVGLPGATTNSHRVRERQREKEERASKRGAHRAIAGAVEFEFAAQILCERKYFYLVNVIYYLCLFEHLSSAA